MQRNWTLNLKQGDWFEDNIAYLWILNNITTHYVSRCSKHKKSSGGGPRLTKSSLSLVLPDFRLDDPSTSTGFWIDSKLKSQPFSLPGRASERFYSIDTRSYDDYKTLISVFKSMPLLIFLGNVKNKTLWTFDFGLTTPTWHTFNNAYGNGPTPCYSELQMTSIGVWDTTGLPK